MKRERKPNAEFLRRYVQRTLVVNQEKDPDVVRKLASVQSANEYILNLIREDIRKEKINEERK